MKEKTKRVFLAAFDIHSTIGKVIDISLIALVLSAVVVGAVKCSDTDQVHKSNHFLNEATLVHGMYNVTAKSVFNTEQVELLDDSKQTNVINSLFIGINLEINCLESCNKDHKLDCNDFKIKNHTGVYVPMSDIMSCLGWDGIDVHLTKEGEESVMSSCDFDTEKCEKDYSFYDTELIKNETYNFTIYFKMDRYIDVKTNITVLEIDFFSGKRKYREGSDIVLLPRPENM